MNRLLRFVLPAVLMITMVFQVSAHQYSMGDSWTTWQGGRCYSGLTWWSSENTSTEYAQVIADSITAWNNSLSGSSASMSMTCSSGQLDTHFYAYTGTTSDPAGSASNKSYYWGWECWDCTWGRSEIKLYPNNIGSSSYIRLQVVSHELGHTWDLAHNCKTSSGDWSKLPWCSDNDKADHIMYPQANFTSPSVPGSHEGDVLKPLY